MHVTSITLQFASFCLFFFISIQSITDIANENMESPLLLQSLEKDLQNPVYIKNILPYDLHYISALLNHGAKTQLDRSYHQSVLRLFTNLFKKTPCINAYCFDEFIVQIPQFLKIHIEPTHAKTILHQIQLMDLEMVHRFQATVNGILFQSLSNHYDIFKKNPEQFLNSISQTITTIAQEEIAIEQLRVALIRFLETGLNKLVWGYDTIETSWENIKNLSKHLADLIALKILDDPCDLDDIYWSLLTRYCYFLEIHATTISMQFYENLEKELDQDLPFIVSLDEQESFIESKNAYFRRTIRNCKTKQSAFQRGIIVS